MVDLSTRNSVIAFDIGSMKGDQTHFNIGGVRFDSEGELIKAVKEWIAYRATGLTPEQVAEVQAKLDNARAACRDGLAWMLHRVGTSGVPAGVVDAMRRIAEDTQEG